MIARKRATGPRELSEILRQATILSADADTADNRYGSGLLEANKAMNATNGLWKAVRHARCRGSAPRSGSAVPAGRIVGYSKDMLIGYRRAVWPRRVT